MACRYDSLRIVLGINFGSLKEACMTKIRIEFRIPARRIHVWKSEATVDLTEAEYHAAQFAASNYKTVICLLNGVPFTMTMVSSMGLRGMSTLKAVFKKESDSWMARCGRMVKK